MRKLTLISILIGFSSSLMAETEIRLNSAEAETECRKQIEEIYATDVQIKFKARPTSSYGSGMYRFWINTTELSDEGRSSRGYLCEITRGGEMVQLAQKNGRWRA